MEGNKSIHNGHRKRLRSQVSEHGFNNLFEHQVLEYMLSFVIPRKDTNPLAHKLIDKFGGFYNVLNADINELMVIDGVGERCASYITSFKQIFNYYQKSQIQIGDKVSNPSEAVLLCKKLLQHKQFEEIYFIGVGSKNEVIGFDKLEAGSLNKVDFCINKVAILINKYKCPNIIITHNHPSSATFPSSKDLLATKAIYFHCKLNNINFLDHIIISDDDCYSFKDNCIFDKYKEDYEKSFNSINLNLSSTNKGKVNEF